MSKKVILKVEVSDEKGKQKAMKAVSGLSGVESLNMDMNSKKLTVVGDVDPVVVVSKIRKSGLHVSIDSVGPAKEEKKDDKKKDEPKKEEPKKDDGKKDDGKKKDPTEKQVEEMVKAYQAYRPYYTTHYNVHSWEDDPNKCVIC